MATVPSVNTVTQLLSRTLLFCAAVPDQRYRVLQRFYGLKPALIERLYAGETTMADQMRILSGKPPVPFFTAVSTWLGAPPLNPLGPPEHRP